MATKNLTQNPKPRNKKNLIITLNHDLDRFTPRFLEHQLMEISIAAKEKDLCMMQEELACAWDALYTVYSSVCQALDVAARDTAWLDFCWEVQS